MSSFLKYLTQDDPQGNCAICGGNRYACTCDDTPVVDQPLNVVMFHPVNHKRITVARYTDKYTVLKANGWKEMDS